MKIVADFHTHTIASDGNNTVRENFKQAQNLGLKTIAITDHGFSSMLCHQTAEKLENQSSVIKTLNGSGDLKILKGLEANIVGFDGKIDITKEEISKLDVLLVGFHRFVFNQKNDGYWNFVVRNGFFPRFAKKDLIEKNTSAFVKAIENNPIDIVAHLGRRTLIDFSAVGEACKKTDTMIELNEKHIEDLEDGIDCLLEIGVKFSLGSDAHKCEKIGQFPRVESFVKKHKIREENIAGVGYLPEFKKK